MMIMQSRGPWTHPSGSSGRDWGYFKEDQAARIEIAPMGKSVLLHPGRPGLSVYRAIRVRLADENYPATVSGQRFTQPVRD